nr:MAG TPA: hypothetical protein [Caudoviricetes sp.]
MNNRKHFDLRICVESICKGVSREIAYAKTLRREVFESDEEFRVYFGLKIDAPAMLIVCGGK